MNNPKKHPVRAAALSRAAGIILLFTLLLQVASCGSSGRETGLSTPAVTTDEPLPEREPLTLIKDGATEFTLVIGRRAPFFCDKMCYEISDAFAALGAEIAVKKDYDLFMDSLDIMLRSKYLLELESLAKGHEPGRFLDASEVENSYDRNAPFEILVGDTDRDASIRAKDELKEENTYIVRVDGNKIVINANSNAALRLATDVFISEILGAGGTESDSRGKIEVLDFEKKGVAGSGPEPAEKLFFGMTQKQIDDSFSDLLDGLFTGKTKEEIYRADIGGNIAMHFPEIIYKDGQYRAYYISYASPVAGAPSTGLAVSDNGFDWKYERQIIDPDSSFDSTGCGFAGVFEDEDGILYLAYEGSGKKSVGQVCLAVSFDGGTSWHKEGIILNNADLMLSWCNYNVGTPDLYKAGDVWYLTFHGFGTGGGNGGCQIGVAFGPSLRDLTVLEDPVLPTEKGTPWSGTTGRRDVLFCGGWYYMVYEISTEAVSGAGYGGAHWSHMFARSRDMIEWETTSGPQLVQPQAGFGNDGPCFCIADGKLYVFMRNVTNCTTAVAQLPTD